MVYGSRKQLLTMIAYFQIISVQGQCCWEYYQNPGKFWKFTFHMDVYVIRFNALGGWLESFRQKVSHLLKDNWLHSCWNTKDTFDSLALWIQYHASNQSTISSLGLLIGDIALRLKICRDLRDQRSCKPFCQLCKFFQKTTQSFFTYFASLHTPKFKLSS